MTTNMTPDSPPSHVIIKALGDLSPGVRITILHMMQEFQAHRLSCSDFEIFLKSVAWQSETLRSYYAEQDNDNLPTEALSDEEMEMLMDSQSASQARTCEPKELPGPSSPLCDPSQNENVDICSRWHGDSRHVACSGRTND